MQLVLFIFPFYFRQWKRPGHAIFKLLHSKKEMFEKNFLLLIFYLFNTAFSLKSTDFCRNKSKDCSRCSQFCHGVYSTKCGPELCAVNHQSCRSIEILANLIHIFKKSAEFKSEMAIFKSLIHNITTCSYKLNPNDICRNRAAGCTQKTIIT